MMCTSIYTGDRYLLHTWCFLAETMSSDDFDSENDSVSEDSLLTSTSSSSDSDDEIDIDNWTVLPTVNRDPFQFVGNSEVQVGDAQTVLSFGIISFLWIWLNQLFMKQIVMPRKFVITPVCAIVIHAYVNGNPQVLKNSTFSLLY